MIHWIRLGEVTEWEDQFLRSLGGQQMWTDKQRMMLKKIFGKYFKESPG